MAEQNEVKEVRESKRSKAETRITPFEMSQITLGTKAQLELQPKVRIRLQRKNPRIDPKNPEYEIVQINGHTFQIMKGVDVDVPQEVANILKEAGIY